MLHKPTATAPGFTEPESFVTFKGFSQPESFVGGVSDGTYGAAAMVFDKMETQGHKAWFFYDRELVALGAGISSSRDEPVATTLNQTLLHGPVLINGHAVEAGEAKVPQASWALHDGVGYAFFKPAAVNIKVGPQTGDWKSVSAEYSDAPVTEQVFALWLDHGVRPRDGQYAYAVLPGIDSPSLEEWAAHPPIRIISNTTAQQAVIHDQLGVSDIVFYTPGSVPLGTGWAVKVDQPCLTLLAKHGTATRISVSSPGGEVRAVHLTLTTPQREQNLIFELPARELAGKSQTMDVTLPLAGVYLPSARRK
jgi:chondroitin AC lyase